VLVTRRVFIGAAIMAAFATPVFARSPVPIIDFKDQAILTTGGKTMTNGLVRDAIIRAANSLGWALAPDGDQRFVGTLVVRSKHTVVVNISYEPDKYSVVYKSSINMKYDIQNGVPVIHPFYNDWAKKLVDAIRVECAKS
jgi:hypothetical protein